MSSRTAKQEHSVNYVATWLAARQSQVHSAAHCLLQLVLALQCQLVCRVSLRSVAGLTWSTIHQHDVVCASTLQLEGWR